MLSASDKQHSGEGKMSFLGHAASGHAKRWEYERKFSIDLIRK